MFRPCSLQGWIPPSLPMVPLLRRPEPLLAEISSSGSWFHLPLMPGPWPFRTGPVPDVDRSDQYLKPLDAGATCQHRSSGFQRHRACGLPAVCHCCQFTANLKKHKKKKKRHLAINEAVLHALPVLAQFVQEHQSSGSAKGPTSWLEGQFWPSVFIAIHSIADFAQTEYCPTFHCPSVSR